MVILELKIGNPAVTKDIQKTLYLKTAYVIETCDLPKFSLKRHLSNGTRTKTLTLSTRAKNRKKTITQKPLTSAKFIIHQNIALVNTFPTVLEP